MKARYFDRQGNLSYGEIEIAGGSVVRFVPLPLSAPEDAPYLLPGLCDIHTHGNSGFDFSEGEYEGLVAMARYLYGCGVTRFSPATVALPEEKLVRALETAKRFFREAPKGCARLAGVTLEGPFLSYAKRGAQSAEHFRNPDYDLYERLQKASGGLIKIVSVAPELPGAMEFIARVSREAKVALAHTDCGYEEAASAFDAGATHVTHLYNAMRPMHHRAPGPVPAAAERGNVTAELILDGVHVHPAMARAAYRLFGRDRLCLISDSMAAAGMGDGEYALGARKVLVKGGRAALADGTIAGSTANLWECMANAVSFGIPPADAVMMAALNPRRAVGLACPVVQEGERAEFVLCDSQFRMLNIYA